MATKTGYSITGGGGKGYINIGGWNTTLTAKSTTQDQIPGTTRREGANLYFYGLQGSLSIEGKNSFVMFVAPAADAGATLISPIVLSNAPAGTANVQLINGMTIQSMSAGVYGWYFKEGITTVTMGADSGGSTVGSPICPATATVGVFATATATGIGWALTAMAADASGPAYVSFKINKQGQSVF